MRIPVLMLARPQEPIRESAQALSEGRTATIPYGETVLPSGFDLDTAMPALPLGTGRIDQVIVSAFNSIESQAFVVRGHMEVDEPEQIPESMDGQPLFADPILMPFVTCAVSRAE